MKKNKYITTTILICIILCIIYQILANIFAKISTNALPIISGFFALTSIFGYTILESAKKQRPQKYINIFMLVSGIKFILNLIVLLILIVLMDHDKILGTIICFSLYYLVFLIYDTKISLNRKKTTDI